MPRWGSQTRVHIILRWREPEEDRSCNTKRMGKNLPVLRCIRNISPRVWAAYGRICKTQGHSHFISGRWTTSNLISRIAGASLLHDDDGKTSFGVTETCFVSSWVKHKKQYPFFTKTSPLVLTNTISKTPKRSFLFSPSDCSVQFWKYSTQNYG